MHEEDDTHFWQRFSQSANYGNEEPGESTLSVFSRKMSHDPCRKDIDHANEYFRVMKPIWECATALDKSMSGAHLQSRKPVIKNDSKHLIIVRDFLVEEVRRLKNQAVHELKDGEDRQRKCMLCHAEHEEVDMYKTKQNRQCMSMRKTRVFHFIHKCEGHLRSLIENAPDWFNREMAHVHPDYEESDEDEGFSTIHEHNEMMS